MTSEDKCNANEEAQLSSSNLRQISPQKLSGSSLRQIVRFVICGVYGKT